MNRRRFIGISILSLVGIAMASIAIIYDFETLVFKILQQDLKTLNIDEKYFRKFASDAKASNYWQRILFDKKKKAFVFAFYFLPKIGLPYEFKYFQLRGRIVGDFLLATDFFVNKMDDKRAIKYVGLYDPYLRPCQNPFSNLNYNPEA
jgi:hypothetical protein